MESFLPTLERQQPAMLRTLRQLVEIESPSTDRDAVNRLGTAVARRLRDAGAAVRSLASRSTGDHLRAEFRFADRGASQILLLGHLDTVWERGTISRMPFRISDGRAYGPGIFDMKGGIVLALFALRALQEPGVKLRKNLVLLLNADEEIGSPSSRPLTEREARRSDSVLVLEPPHGPTGSLKTARKGVGEFVLTVRGRAAHAGIEPEKGASAITEIARQIARLDSLAAGCEGATLNPGIVQGGTRSNVVAAEAMTRIDVRVVRREDQSRLEKRLRRLKPFDRRTTLRMTGGFNRPPMERTAQTAELFAKARRLAKPLGIRLTETMVGGGSDGNFTAALGVPTLDGLGAVGDGAHAAHEHILIAEFPRRAALLAHLIAELASEANP